jgi:4-hydroxy-3-methylbut-2-enyl diphosphate reductase
VKMKVYLARPRGFCAGVDRAIDIVKLSLEIFGPPVYVRHEIVHNHHVVNNLRERGAIFVEDLGEIPRGAVTIFSAHGVSPAVRQEAARRSLRVIDATCPLVTKVHLEAIHFARQGFHIALIGHRHHVEVEGTMGEAPDSMTLVETLEDVANMTVPDTEKVAVLTQTTLSLDDANHMIAALKQRFPGIRLPRSGDICYATTNRQAAVRRMAETCDLILVIGSSTSSNSNRLVEVAISQGARSLLVDDSSQIRTEMLSGVRTLGITAGASAPENVVQEVLRWIQTHFEVDIEPLEVVSEEVSFTIPKELADLARQAGRRQDLVAKHTV